jgi:hypothetical protein
LKWKFEVWKIKKKKTTKKYIFHLIFLPLDPDSQYGSGSTKSLNPDQIRIRIHNPANIKMEEYRYSNNCSELNIEQCKLSAKIS